MAGADRPGTRGKRGQPLAPGPDGPGHAPNPPKAPPRETARAPDPGPSHRLLGSENLSIDVNKLHRFKSNIDVNKLMADCDLPTSPVLISALGVEGDGWRVN